MNGGRACVEQSGGRIHGSSSNGQVNLVLERSDGEQWVLRVSSADRMPIAVGASAAA
jgi:hypothetical protein